MYILLIYTFLRGNLMSDATSMAEDFASGRSDPVHVLEQALDKASRAPAVFISLTAARARREAEASAARWRAGQPLSVFDGVPLAWKDLFDVAGSITTAGAAFRRPAPAALLDAPSVGLLCRAGMVSVGKTNLSELAYSGPAPDYARQLAGYARRQLAQRSRRPGLTHRLAAQRP